MKVDLLMPSYGSVHPQTKFAVERMLEYSQCRCFVDAAKLVSYAGATLRSRNGNVKDLLELLKAKGLEDAACHDPDQCPKGKHDVWAAPLASSSIIHWTRNNALMKRRPDADHYLFCDADIVPPVNALDRLLAYKKDVIAGLCTKRVDPPEPNHRRWVEYLQNYEIIRDWPRSPALLEVDAIGTGFMLLSRAVVEAVAEYYHPHYYKETGDGYWFEFIRTPTGGEWGEDLSFCWKAQRIGFSIFCDTSVCPQHMGDYNYNVDDYLDNRDDFSVGTLREQGDLMCGRRIVGAADALALMGAGAVTGKV